MPPMLVPTMTSGFTSATRLLRKGNASMGSTGMSGATISAEGSILRKVSTVPLAPEEAKPWK